MIAVVTFIFTGPVPALQDIWMVGDSFVKKLLGFTCRPQHEGKD